MWSRAIEQTMLKLNAIAMEAQTLRVSISGSLRVVCPNVFLDRYNVLKTQHMRSQCILLASDALLPSQDPARILPRSVWSTLLVLHMLRIGTTTGQQEMPVALPASLNPLCQPKPARLLHGRTNMLACKIAGISSLKSAF
jgi:hypothetical protein